MSHVQKPGMAEPLLGGGGMGGPGRTNSSRSTPRPTSANNSGAFGYLDEEEAQLFATMFMIEDASVLQLVGDSSCGYKMAKAAIGLPLTLGIPVLGWAYGCAKVKLVPQGHIGLVMNSGRPELLGPGWHAILEPLRSWQGCVPLSQEVIKFSTMEVVTVKDGFIGLAWDRGQPILLPPGMHQWDSPTMKFDKVFDRRTNFQAGPFTFCTIQKGDVGVSFDRGELKLLHAGYHVLKHALHKYSHNISIRQQFDRLTSSKLLSQDTVELDLDATVSWQVLDPQMAALNARDMDHLRELVHRQARAALSECVFKMAISTSQASSGLSQSTDGVLGGAGEPLDGGVAQPVSMADVAGGNTQQAQSVSSLSEACSNEDTLRQCNAELTSIGIRINKIAIVKLDITDVEVLRALAKGATIAVAIREKRKVAEVEAESTVLQARANAEGRRLEAQAEAYAERQRAEAQQYYAEKVAASAEALSQNPLAGRLMELHASGGVLASTASSLIITGGGGDVASTLLGNSSLVGMPK